jgi:hypothetical protein
MSETYVYFEFVRGKPRAVAIVHQYVLNGEIQNRAGPPDPKWLRIGDDIYKFRRRGEPAPTTTIQERYSQTTPH